MIRQNDMRLRVPIREHGCYFMSLLELINRYTNLPLSVNRINNSIYLGAIQQGHMTMQCYMQDPSGFCKWLGWNATYTDRHEKPTYLCKDNEAEVLCFEGKYGAHFVSGDGKGHVAYDPYYTDSGGSASVRFGELVSKRVFRF